MAALIIAGRLLGEASLAGESPGRRSHPQLVDRSPASARALLEWYELRYGDRMQGARDCPPLDTLSVPGSFPRGDEVDAVFLDYSSKGGLWEAIAIDRFGSFEERLAQMESQLPCVSRFALHTVGSELATIASSQGRDAAADEAAAILQAFSSEGLNPDRYRVWRVWKDYALVETTGSGDQYLLFLRSRSEGWAIIGQVWNGVSCEFAFAPPTIGSSAPTN